MGNCVGVAGVDEAVLALAMLPQSSSAIERFDLLPKPRSPRVESGLLTKEASLWSTTPEKTRQ